MAEPFHCDCSRHLSMAHLGNCLLNAADFHADSCGFGMRRLNPEGKTWVLSRLAIEVVAMPEEYARFSVETWIESVMKYFTYRNFIVADAEKPSRIYGYARSVWALIDTSTRRPLSIDGVADGGIARSADPSRDCPIARPSRVTPDSEAQTVVSFAPSYGDIDVNGHVNSIKYLEHVLNIFSPDWHVSHPLRRVDIAYGAESHYGDTLSISRHTLPDGSVSVAISKALTGGGAADVCRFLLQFS